MATSYRLVYSNYRGRAEPIRMVFVVAGVDYEDARPSVDEIMAMKPKLPYGQIPILEFGDTVLSQSHAIGRFLSKRFGLHGKTDIEAAKIDEFVDACGDCFEAYVSTHKMSGEAKETALKNFLDVVCPKYFSKFNETLQNSGGKYVMGSRLTWADIILYCDIEFLEAATQKQLAKDYPALHQFVKEFTAVPSVKEWIEKRPKTNM